MQMTTQIRRAFIPALLTALALTSTSGLAQDSGTDDLDQFVPVGNEPYDNTVRRFVDKEKPKIVGGKPAPDGAFPWQVSLMVSRISDPAAAHFCGGTIVNKRWIRTAAHCLINLQPRNIHVASGANELESGIKRSEVELMIVHKDFNKPKHRDNDMALLKLKNTLGLDSKTKAIALAPKGYSLTSNKTLVASGWGATREGGSGVKDLRQISVPFVDRGDCNDPLSYNGRVTKNMICAGRMIGGRDSCRGDSGGPLMDLKGPAAPVQVGVTSWGKGCARAGKPGVYADGRRYGDWEKGCIASPSSCR